MRMIQMYSAVKLSGRKFELSDDPYEEDVSEELRKLGVFFYRDEDHPNAVLVDPVPSERGQGFYHQLFIDEDTMCVDEWENPPDNHVEKHGDKLAWLWYNKEVILVEVTKGYVKREF
jgi:hypothetical protein